MIGRWRSLAFYWRLSRVKCVGTVGVLVLAPRWERVRWTLRWWLRQEREVWQAIHGRRS